MEHIDSKEISKASNVFAKAMFNDPLHIYFFPNEKTRYKKLLSIYKFLLITRKSNVFKTSPLLEGFCIWEEPYKHNKFSITFKDVIFGFPLLFSVGVSTLLRMIKYEKWSSNLRISNINEPYWYLQVIVVDPEYQGKGFASKLIRPIIEKAKKNNQNIFLETQNTTNVGIYKKYGLEPIIETVLPETNIKHYCMRLSF